MLSSLHIQHWSPTNYSIQISGDGISWQTVVTRSNSAPVVNGNDPLTATSGTVPLILNVLKSEAQQREEKEHV